MVDSLCCILVVTRAWRLLGGQSLGHKRYAQGLGVRDRLAPRGTGQGRGTYVHHYSFYIHYTCLQSFLVYNQTCELEEFLDAGHDYSIHEHHVPRTICHYLPPNLSRFCLQIIGICCKFLFCHEKSINVEVKSFCV